MFLHMFQILLKPLGVYHLLLIVLEALQFFDKRTADNDTITHFIH